MDGIDLAQCRDRRLALVNKVINISFHNMRGISSLAEDLFASQEGFCSMELVSYICKIHVLFSDEESLLSS